MSIVQHHPFGAYLELEHTVIRLNGLGVVTSEARAEFQRWHSTLRFKLDCADHYFDETSKYDRNLSSAIAEGIPPVVFHHLNRALDSFLSCLFSAQDVLAKELNFVYGDPMAGTDRWNLTTLRERFKGLAGARPAIASVTTILDTALDRNLTPLPPLLEIRDYRSAATHEMLIPTTELTILSGGTGSSASAKLYLPDASSSLQCTRVKELCPTCANWFADQLGCFDQIYRALDQEIQAHKSVPLP